MEYKLLENEIDELVQLYTKNNWPYHGNNQVSEESIRKFFHEGYYHKDRETFWIIDNGMKVGLLLIHDIDDTIPLFDIRLDEKYRGQGYGMQALKWLQDYLFGTKQKIRVEGYTRADNLGMRKCFTRAGFVKEGYLRNAWENADGTISDTVLYGAIKEDWENNRLTPSKIDAVPY
ncbi:GNAT family N-acetyltransferase [Lysinibacillus odysseyi]|uniref:Acetyltransferase n=1 Tax=Lysinibacillus odysseyi 34hs-1 = NBRC 100172 TaxID=1220589 RepID=A0A0A3IH04_9BACI|nr:GNAT family protein [Lysinibacillus odysseyi]KGR82103.1 acetyltransferase [Lysinibacillus odysseyi 34hs-1 = NBRC 100172]